MTLTPTIKFFLVASIAFVNIVNWIWTGIQTDVLALGLDQHVFNIGVVILSSLVTAGSGVLTYLGLRNPLEKPAES